MIDYEDKPNGRVWCYSFQFPGKQIAMAGTVYARIGAPNHEIEEECRKHWRQIFPDALECPLVQLAPGQMVFVSGVR